MFDKGFVPSRKMTLGGMGENFPAFRRLLDQVITWHESWRHSLAQSDPPAAELTLTAEEERALGTAIQEFLERFMDEDPDSARFFINGTADKYQFDLVGHGLSRLRAAGVGDAQWTGHCTYSDPARFYSYRRATHLGEADYGRMIAAIRL